MGQCAPARLVPVHQEVPPCPRPPCRPLPGRRSPRWTRSCGTRWRPSGRRQRDKIELIASENYVFAPVLEAQGSWLTNKYAEGLPGKRYYGGCEHVDVAEELAIERALALFPGADHVNVQPHSGAQANMAAYFSVLRPGDRILGMNLAHGGHLTHGSPVNFSGRLYEVHAYGVDRATERIDYDALAAPGRGGPAQGGRRRRVGLPADLGLRADGRRSPTRVGALLFVDMAHFAGLVAAGLHPSPFPHADLVTTTTHKTLRGPRGGLVFARADLPEGVDRADFPALGKSTLAQAIDKSVFPGVQGGPLMHVVAAKAVALRLAAERRVPARPGADHRERAGARPRRSPSTARASCSGGTDNHLALVDVTPLGVTGREAETPARRRRHHRQQERDPVRREPAQHRLGDPGRHAGHHHAGHGHRRDADDRAADRGGDPRPRRRRASTTGSAARCATSWPVPRARAAARPRLGGAARRCA